MLRSGPDGWAKHCIHDFSDKWVPERHTLVTMTRMIEKSLEHPNKKDPWEDYLMMPRAREHPNETESGERA